MEMRMNRRSFKQRGAALFISLIMLVLITLFVLASINMSSVNLRITANTQVRNEAIAAAQQAIEQVASRNFPANPQAATISVDMHNDSSKTDYTVAVAKPACVNTVPITMAELAARDNSDPDDVACRGSASMQNPGLLPPAENNSLCKTQQWDVAATVADTGRSGANVTVHQGLSRRIEISTTC
jgi:Tfp pilus assembly protein PilX